MSEQTPHPRVYFTVFAVLLVVTLITVLIARIVLGPINVVVALGIASSKALLVIFYFMHLKYSARLTGLWSREVSIGSAFYSF